jgi:hypothetical protein
MRAVAGALLAMTSACMTPATGKEPLPVQGEATGQLCDASSAQELVGQAATSELGARALQLTGARTIRWIRPGQAVTMDYRADRLNISIDDRNRVERVTCG